MVAEPEGLVVLQCAEMLVSCIVCNFIVLGDRNLNAFPEDL